jgi:hypothetical protein
MNYKKVKNSTKYNEIIRKIIKYTPQIKKTFTKDDYSGEPTIQFEDKARITLCGDSTWEQIKKYIDTTVLNPETVNECSICASETAIKIRKINCNKCRSAWCIECYINIFKTNQGLIKCPYCRYEYGQKFPKFMIEGLVQQILDTI